MRHIIIDNGNYYRRASVNGDTPTPSAERLKMPCAKNIIEKKMKKKNRNQLAEAEKFKNRSSTITRII